MSDLFNGIIYFNGDISKWNVCKVENMMFMFMKSPFNVDISKWNVCNVTYMSDMFVSCPCPRPAWYKE